MRLESRLLIPLLAAALFYNAPVSAQEKKDSPRPAAGFEGKEVKSESMPQFSLLVEFFELDHRSANKLVSQFAPRAADAGELRNILDAKVKQGDAELVETGWLRGLSGNRVKLESIHEHIYATEYDPAEIPNTVGGNLSDQAAGDKKKGKAVAAPLPPNAGSPDGPAIHITSANPSAFETRHLGLTIEADVVISENRHSLEVNAAIERTERIDDRYFTRPDSEDTAHGIDHISMPNFYTMTNTIQFTCIPGRSNLVGFHTPYQDPDRRILCLVTTELILAKTK